MNERLKEARKALRLNQTDFGARIGVTDGAISRLEKGSNNLTDQMLLAVCREFSINEEWLRYGVGEMFIENDGTILATLAEEFALDGLDQKILETYLRLPEERRKAVKDFLVQLARAIESGEAESAEEFIATHPVEASAARFSGSVSASQDVFGSDWGKGLTRAQHHALVDARHDAAEKGLALSTTSGKDGSASTLKMISNA